MVIVSEDNFGTIVNPLTKRKVRIRRFTLSNSNQMSIQLLTYGLNVASIRLPDKNGQVDEITLSFDRIDDYITTPVYFGATVGRVANRVANGCFKLNGEKINVTKNFQGIYQLHGGFIGFDRVIWDVVKTLPNGVIFKHISPDGHEGYPGEVTCIATCTLNDNNEFRLQLDATTSETTCINLTNHTYFNLAGHNSGKQGLYQHTVMINADNIVAINPELLPTGELVSVADTVYDLRAPVKLADRLSLLKDKPAKGYDDCFCVNGSANRLTCVARIDHSESGRWLEVLTNQPGLQFYTGNFLPDVENGAPPIQGKGGAQYEKQGGFCLETQKYPDSMNHDNFPSIILNPGEKYYHDVVYKFNK